MQLRILTILFLIAVTTTGILLTSSQLHAQVTMSENGISIVAKPSYPEPESSVTLTLDDYAADTIGSTISWYVEGEEVPNSRNERSITIQAGKLGTSKAVTVRLSRDGVVLSATHTIRPIDVSIVIEADTYVPSFYKGRALPSAEANVRAIAIVNDGSGITWDTYSYEWTLGQTVLSGGPIKGKYAIDIALPYFRTTDLTVAIYDRTGTPIGSKTMKIDAAEPQLLFYEHSPLRGLSEKAIDGELIVTGKESVIYAEPFFLNAPNLLSQNALFEWKLNNARVTNTMQLQNAITLGTTGGASKAKVSASALTTDSALPQRTQNSFMVSFE